MKKITFLFLILLTSFSFAQKKGKFRASLDLSYLIPSAVQGEGVALYLEPMYNIKDNMSIGIRVGNRSLSKTLEFSNGDTSDTASESNILSYIATFDYHFNKNNFSIIPFVGGGLGYTPIPNIGANRFSDIDHKTQYSEKINAMIRGGFEWKKLRLSLDYNFIPKSDLIYIDGSKIGYSKNSYFGISLGFFVGGGKW